MRLSRRAERGGRFGWRQGYLRGVDMLVFLRSAAKDLIDDVVEAVHWRGCLSSHLRQLSEVIELEECRATHVFATCSRRILPTLRVLHETFDQVLESMM